MTHDHLRPFRVAWDSEKVERTLAQVRAFRMPRVPKDAGWQYGCEPTFLEALRSYWSTVSTTRPRWSG